jgi:hypothetical protein
MRLSRAVNLQQESAMPNFANISFAIFTALALIACGSVEAPALEDAAAGSEDAAANGNGDGSVDNGDASLPDDLDAGSEEDDSDVPQRSTSTRSLSPASSRVQGGGYTVDVEFGMSVTQRPVSGGGSLVEGAPVVEE